MIIGIVIGIVLGAFGFIASIWLWIRSDDRKRIKEESRYNAEKPRYDIAKHRWDYLYYCHRDGIVFNPNTGETCEPANFKEFIYR